jgi:RNA polymerase sigma-70 factor (ECF subfamily)
VGHSRRITLDSSEFAQLAAEEHPRLVRALTLACGDPHVAEDAVQDALVRAWERVDRGEPFTSLTGWIAVVAMNNTRTTFRRRAAEGRARGKLQQRVLHVAGAAPDATADVVVDGLARDDAAAALQLAIIELPPRQREVTVLHYYLHHDVQSIAELLGITPGAVKNALFYARATLAKHLDATSRSRTTETTHG